MVDLKLGFAILISLLTSIYIVESTCSRGCETALGSYYIWVGTNLSFIAEVTNGDINNIFKYNPRVPNQDSLLVGSRINVPFPCDCINGKFLGHMFNYRIRPGDTYNLVANRNYANLTTAAWTETYNSYSETMIPDNAFLNVTVNCSCGDSGASRDHWLFVTYPLRPEDSLSSIASQTNLSADLLQSYNPDVNFSAGAGLVYIPWTVGVVLVIAFFAMVVFYFIWKFSLCGKCMLLWWKKTERDQNIENFLKNNGSFAPKRYSYSNVKKMTNSFKEKLGQGGYGHVYKGKLCNGNFVAVKILKGSKGNGEDFINEVASISKTSHVNIVNLLGFCFEGHKRALVYEFMPNGSLEKFIYDGSSLTRRQLGWEKLYQIAVGIARGLEYLHRGCNTRILHFDIKPNNILLDEDFCPKIADFGLAKLCPGKESILSRVTARGTFGYMAPELVFRNFGGVSYKSDVYSYGMMVSEMVGGRKNVDVKVVHTSEIYFPHWIYHQLESNNELGLHGIVNEEENEIARKMIIVSLWCIQTDPITRPSMTRVVEMLEGSLESLQIPPKPYLSSPSRSPDGSLTMWTSNTLRFRCS